MRRSQASRRLPVLLGAAIAVLAVLVFSPNASAHEVSSDWIHALSDYEDAKGGPEQVTETERRAILRGQTPRVLGAATRTTAAVVVKTTPSAVLQSLSDHEDAKGGEEQVTEVERRTILRGQTPRVLGAVTEATAVLVSASSKGPLEVLSDFEDARGGMENVTEAERRALVRGDVPRVKGATTVAVGTGVQSLRGEVTELTPSFVEVWYEDAAGIVVRRRFALTASTDMRAHVQRGDQVEVRFDRTTWTALVVRDLAPAGDEMRFGANDCSDCPGAVA